MNLKDEAIGGSAEDPEIEITTKALPSDDENAKSSDEEENVRLHVRPHVRERRICVAAWFERRVYCCIF